MISMHIQYMTSSTQQCKHILLLLYKVVDVSIVLLLRSIQSAHLCYTIMDGYIRYFGSLTHIVCNQDPTFISRLAPYICQELHIKILKVNVPSQTF